MEKYYMNLTFAGVCQTYVGKVYARGVLQSPGNHVVYVGIGCITHEIMHALGKTIIKLFESHRYFITIHFYLTDNFSCRFPS